MNAMRKDDPGELERRAEELRSHVRSSLDELDRRSHVRIANGVVRDEEAAESPERERLEERADQVRNHLVDRIEEIEKKARERILPIVTVGGALLVMLTIGFGVLFYRSLRR